MKTLATTLALLGITLGATGCLFHKGGGAAAAPAAAGPKPKPLPAAKGDIKELFSLRAIDTRIGTGALMAARKCVYVHYTGWLPNGTRFDGTRDTMPNGRITPPLVFAQGARRVISGWDVGFEGMKVGGVRRLLIPYQLGYGEPGRPPTIPPKSPLVFDVELMAVADTLPLPRAANAVAPQCPTWADVSQNR